MATLYIDKTNGNFLTVVLGKDDILKVTGERGTNTYTYNSWAYKYSKGIWKEDKFHIVGEGFQGLKEVE
jgi:hypothetical protein